VSKLKSVEELFKGRHFERGIVILSVHWYLRCKLSLRDLVEMMAERGLAAATYDHHALGAALGT
jgi:transposase-like protein